MKNLKIIALTLIISLFSITTVFATASNEKDQPKTEGNNSATIKESAEFQKVIDEYKEYAAKIPPEVRDEVITYRKEIARLNKEKRLLYKKLSEPSQDYLKKEQEYKKRLPLNRKSLINVEGQAKADKAQK